MLSRPDFMEKQIVVVFSHELRKLRFANENIVIEEDGKIVNQTSLHKVFSVFLIGEATISTKLIRELKSFGVSLVLLRTNLELVDVIGDSFNGNTLLREKQYETFHIANGMRSSFFARSVIENKIANQETLCQKIRNKNEIIQATAEKLHGFRGDAYVCSDPQRLLGIEWNAAKYFFQWYFREMSWIGRQPRTKFDRINVLMDMGYTFLFHFVEAMLMLYGFDTYEGFYHTRFYQRKSLVCDIQEPFRCVIDEALRKAYNLGQVDEKDFGFSNGAYFLKGESVQKYSRIFCRSLLNHKDDLYGYVYAFYRHVLDPKSPFPRFDIC